MEIKYFHRHFNRIDCHAKAGFSLSLVQWELKTEESHTENMYSSYVCTISASFSTSLRIPFDQLTNVNIDTFLHPSIHRSITNINIIGVRVLCILWRYVQYTVVAAAIHAIVFVMTRKQTSRFICNQKFRKAQKNSI